MKLVQKILVSTFSDVVITIIGFLGTLYFARVLGAGPIGTFALGLTVVQGFLLIDLGVGQAAMKRISADNDPDSHFSAALLIYGVILLAALPVIFIFRNRINAYVGGEFALIVAVIFAFQRLYQMANLGIKGRNRVHIRDSIDALEQIVRVGCQALFVFLGFQTIALFIGYAASFGVAVLLAFTYLFYALSFSLTRPKREHYRSLYKFAKFSWLGNVKSRAFSWVDIAVLGFFVSNAAIGIYQVSWTLAMTFQILGMSIGRNLFPEISEVASSGNMKRIEDITRGSFTFGGLLPIPGVVGAFVIGERVLGVYGATFRAGGPVLAVLAVVSLFRAYEGSIYALANGLNKPRIPFVSGFTFIFSNILLNILFVYYYGTLGAATATAIALIISLTLAWILVGRHVDVEIPLREIGMQIVSALFMGSIVWGLKSLLTPLSVPQMLGIIMVGALIYFGLVFKLSEIVRSQVLDILA